MWTVLTDNLAHITSLEPDGVRVLAPLDLRSRGVRLKHALSME